MLHVRRLNPGDEADARALTRLVADLDAHADANADGDLAAWLAQPAHVMVGAWQDAEPAGMAYGYHLPRPDGRPAMLLLFSIDVAEPYRRHGIGSAILAAFRAEASGDTWLVTNEHARAALALYRGAGGVRPHDDDVMIRFPA